MIISNFFAPQDRLVHEALVTATYDEVQQQFENLFKLDEFPELIVDTTFDASKTTQPMAWMGTRLEVQKGTSKVKAITPDTMVIQVVPFYVYMNELGFHRTLNDIQFQAVMKEFIRSYMIYNLIKAHSMKYDYDRFIGEDAGKPQAEIMQTLITQEEELYYYKALKDFYLQKLPENTVGIMFTVLNFAFIEYLQNNRTVKGMGKDSSIMRDVWEIASTAKKIY
jgi:hypothetical protein